ncbi:MAG: MFS transporter [Solirubrobacteraceae bacterium]
MPAAAHRQPIQTHPAAEARVSLVTARPRSPTQPSAVGLAVAGSATVATAFGMARYGYGLLLPDIQHALALRAATMGAVGTLAYVSYLVAAALVSHCVARAGARATVVAGGGLAVAGTITVALATGPVPLALGVAIAGASAGLVYPPFAEAIRQLPDTIRARTLTTINCGTGWGVAIAAPIAILTGSAWRAAYLGFAGCAALSTLYAARTLPGGATPRTTHGNPPQRAGMRRAATPMLASAVLVGLGSAAFWTFAVDGVRHAGLDPAAGRALLGVTGITSLLSIGAADLIDRLGTRPTFVLSALLQAAAIATIGLAAHSLPAVLLAAGAFGTTYNTIVAVTVLWGTRLNADRPAAGVAAAAGANAIGLLTGAFAGGIIADTLGLSATLVIGGAVLLATIPLAPRTNIIQSDTNPPHNQICRDGVRSAGGA